MTAYNSSLLLPLLPLLLLLLLLAVCGAQGGAWPPARSPQPRSTRQGRVWRQGLRQVGVHSFVGGFVLCNMLNNTVDTLADCL
jgi:hypothetical protein